MNYQRPRLCRHVGALVLAWFLVYPLPPRATPLSSSTSHDQLDTLTGGQLDTLTGRRGVSLQAEEDRRCTTVTNWKVIQVLESERACRAELERHGTSARCMPGGGTPYKSIECHSLNNL